MSMFSVKLFTTIMLANTTASYLHFIMYKNMYKKNSYISDIYIAI